MSKVQIDNSNLNLKIQLRIRALERLGNPKTKVLDAYAGKGRIWSEVKKRRKEKLDITSIEIKRNKGSNLFGDNRKLLPSLELNQYDIIDLDAYGVPYEQLKEIFNQNFNGVVCVTYILKSLGLINRGLLNEIGYTTSMIKKCPTLFCINPLKKMSCWLAQNGVKEICGYFLEGERKNYFYFRKE